MMGTYIFRTAVAVLLLFITQPAQARAGSVTDDGRIRGRADAPITLIEFADFNCGYCGKWTAETLPRLDEKYIQTGKLRMADEKCSALSARIAALKENGYVIGAEIRELRR
jgi:hypothetical protein